MKTLIFICLILVCWKSAYSAPVPQEEQAIEHLIGFIEQSNMNFIREGKTYSAQEAADHIRFKYKRARLFIHTADQFIDKVATGSYLTGHSYQIRYADGHTEPTAVWLKKELASYKEKQLTAMPPSDKTDSSTDHPDHRARK